MSVEVELIAAEIARFLNTRKPEIRPDTESAVNPSIAPPNKSAQASKASDSIKSSEEVASQQSIASVKLDREAELSALADLDSSPVQCSENVEIQLVIAGCFLNLQELLSIRERQSLRLLLPQAGIRITLELGGERLSEGILTLGEEEFVLQLDSAQGIAEQGELNSHAIQEVVELQNPVVEVI